MLPKVLIINQPFNNYTGGGITLTNLFSGWDKDKIAVVCYHYLLEKADTNVCDTYYQLGHKEYKFVFPFNFLKRKQYSGILKFEEKKSNGAIRPKSAIREKIITDYFLPLVKYFRIINSIVKIDLSTDLCEWLRDYNPDIIYAQAVNREGIKFISDIHSLLKKPLVFHMMDDWPAVVDDKGILKSKEYRKNDVVFRNFLSKPSALMSISNEMSLEYKNRYGKDFIAFHNPIDTRVWGKYRKKTYALTDSPTILYAGRTGPGIDESLLLIAKAIQKVNHRLQLSVKLVLQSKEKPAWSSRYECIEHKNYVPYHELPKVFSGADFLILPYDFSPETIQFISFSMPTKATEYMISGTPIIIFAPKETAIVKYASRHKWAKVITDNDVDSVSGAIEQLILNIKDRKEIAQNALRIAEENHASLKVQAHFREVICSLIHEDVSVNPVLQ